MEPHGFDYLSSELNGGPATLTRSGYGMRERDDGRKSSREQQHIQRDPCLPVMLATALSGCVSHWLERVVSPFAGVRLL